MSQPAWLNTKVKGLLLDIYGVLVNSTAHGTEPIEGSIEAVEQLKNAGFPVRFCSNESQLPQIEVVKKLQNAGFPVEAHELFTPIQQMKQVLQKENLRPHLLVHRDAEKAFADINQEDPNCVVLGDAADDFSYEAMNSAFNVLLKSPKLFSMGYGKFYKNNNGLVLDVGSYAKAFEYACGIQSTVVGKPSSEYFLAAVNDLNLDPSDVAMIGDDIVSDVGGAQKCGMRGIQVRTGKFRPSKDEPHESVNPDGYVDNLSQAINFLMESQ